MTEHAASPLPSGLAGVERLRKALGQLVNALETTRMATAFTDALASDDRIIFVNDAFLALTGFTREEILGTPIRLVLGKIADARTLSEIEQATDLGFNETWKMPCRRADKSEFLATVFLSPVRDARGIVQFYFLTLVNPDGLTGHPLTEQQELHAIYENAPGFIALTEGPEHRFTDANASYKKLVGRMPLTGLKVSEALPELVDQGVIAILDHAYSTGEPFAGRDMPMDILNPATGLLETRYLNFIYQPVRDATGAIVGLFCEGYDITQHREVSRALEVSQTELIHASRINAMGTMTATLAHELNQPLSAIANYCAGLRMFDPTLDNRRIVQAICGIEEASQHAADIIKTLRDLTRRRQPDLAVFNLKGAAVECVRLVRASHSLAIEFVNSIPRDLSIVGDRVQIEQVIINLLLNACDSIMGSERCQISLTARESGNCVIISVVDTGRGLPDEAAKKLFSSPISSKDGGMGIGLSICRTIVEAHGGHIWLEKTGPTGSELCFSVPLISTLSAADVE